MTPPYASEEEQGQSVGASLSATGLSQVEPQEGLAPTGFDPSRAAHSEIVAAHPEWFGMEEYMRRNLVVCSSYGAAAGVRVALERALSTKRTPRWLVETLQGALDRSEALHGDLVSWRELAPDHPYKPGGRFVHLVCDSAAPSGDRP